MSGALFSSEDIDLVLQNPTSEAVDEKAILDFMRDDQEDEFDDSCCVNCKGEMVKAEEYIECRSCGWRETMIDEITVYAAKGEGGSGQNSFYTVDQVSYNHNKQVKELSRLNYDAAISFMTSYDFSQTISLYNEITSHGIIHRGKVRKSIMITLLHHVLEKRGICKTTKQIAACLGVPDTHLSKAGGLVAKYIAEGKLKLSSPSTDIIPGCVRQLINKFNIPDRYADFPIDIIKTIKEEQIRMDIDPKPTTKVSVAVTLLCKSVPELQHHKATDIYGTFGITSTTFQRYWLAIRPYIYNFAKVFEKYGIPLPIVK